MKIFTMGFAQKSAEEFFSLLEKQGIERLVDIRLNNVSQMAGFTKRDDLKYFLQRISGIDYVHAPLLAPEKEALEAYRSDKDWEKFKARFRRLLEERKPLEQLGKDLFADKVACLLCSEPEAERCHRRLVAEHLAKNIGKSVEIIHL
jgi:uncharacterized protein (DUF488 family)